MGEVEYWLLAAIAFGVISAGFYTWLSSGRSNRLWLFIRSAITYTVIAFAIIWIIFKIANL